MANRKLSFKAANQKFQLIGNLYLKVPGRASAEGFEGLREFKKLISNLEGILKKLNNLPPVLKVTEVSLSED